MPNCGIKRFVTQASFPGRDRPAESVSEAFERQKISSRNAALDLGYPPEVVEQVNAAKSIAEINLIMHTARHSDKRVYNRRKEK